MRFAGVADRGRRLVLAVPESMRDAGADVRGSDDVALDRPLVRRYLRWHDETVA